MSAPSSNLTAEPESLAVKEREFLRLLRSYGQVMVAYSGGVDSAYLAWAAHRELRENMIAVLADSPSLARSQMHDALAFAEEQGIPLRIVNTGEMDRPRVPPQRRGALLPLQRRTVHRYGKLPRTIGVPDHCLRREC